MRGSGVGWRKDWGLFAALVCLLQCGAARVAAAQDKWEQPAAALAEQIAAILGTAQARLTIRNASSIAVDEIPTIRRLLTEDLKARGIQASGAESANTIRVTLSENVRERLWVAEVVEGNETRVTMVHVDAAAAKASAVQERVILRKEPVFCMAKDSAGASLPAAGQVLAVLDTHAGLVVLRDQDISVFTLTTARWKQQASFPLGARQALVRDPHGILVAAEDGHGFTAYAPGTACTGVYAQANDGSGRYGDWNVHCHASDDPWPISATGAAIRAFYNAARDYYTGVVMPSLGVDLPPFYSAAVLPRSDGAALLINGIDGKVQLAENGALKTVAGTRDWGSDFAVLQSGCGAGTQIVASGSGEAVTDSLRAYELPALEAVPASAPLAMEGTVTALASAPDGKSVFAIVRRSPGQGQADAYEVDGVTAHCD